MSAFPESTIASLRAVYLNPRLLIKSNENAVFSRCATNARSCTLLRAFPTFIHKAKNRRTPLATVKAVTILGGNYLIAQQLPASSPKASFFSIYESDLECKVFIEKILEFFGRFLMIGLSVCNGYRDSPLTRAHAFSCCGLHSHIQLCSDYAYTICR